MKKVPDEVLLEIAKKSIEETFADEQLIDKARLLAQFPGLAEEGAVFVTLNKMKDDKKTLRGCIGSVVPHGPLLDDIIRNAKAAAFSDPRFPPLRPEELENLEIEVSVLSYPGKVDYADAYDLQRKIIPGRHGVILKSGGKQATFLPQVWEKLPDFNLFFAQLCNKAGLPADCLNRHPDIYVYEVHETKAPWKRL